MEQASHRLDHEAMLADRAAVADRIRREVDEVVAAAAEKRRASVDQSLEKLGLEARTPMAAIGSTMSSDREAERLLVASARAAEDVREASRAEAVRTLTEAREASALVEAQTERERAVLAEIQERRAQAEREAEVLLVETERVESEMQERRARAERDATKLLAEAREEADRILATAEQERRAQAGREADEILAQARVEAERIVAATEEERRQVRRLLAEAIASLDVDATAAGSTGSLGDDLVSRQPGTSEPTDSEPTDPWQPPRPTDDGDLTQRGS